MKLSFLPREDQFFGFLTDLAGLIVQGGQTLAEVARDWSPDAPSLQRLSDLETQSDKLRHDIVFRINETFVTPIDREDIHAIATRLTAVLGCIHDVAMRMQVYALQTLPEACHQLIDILSEATKVVGDIVTHLAGFHDCSARRTEMQELERRADTIYRSAMGELFRGGHDPLFVIQCKDIYDNLETTVDRCLFLCDTLEAIILKHA